MLFNSDEFLFVFLPAALLGFGLCARWASQAATLAFLFAASLGFYAWWSWRYLALLGVSMAFNYGWAALVRRQRAAPLGRRRGLLAAGVAVNLGLLAYFKYAGFLTETLDAILGTAWHVERIIVPLAISFFTFEQITYLVDAHRGQAPPHGALQYGVFATFFPRLLAGPIVRPAQILPQLARPLGLAAAPVADGLLIFAVGLFKKVVIADAFAPWVEAVFDRAAVVPFADAWGAAVAFALQIYFDFSGYTDMAIGLARMFGIALPENFDSPYQARSIAEYWRRWHITLSTFLRDYVYIPLGGNRTGAVRAAVNVFVTMVLGGLWHGANWTFVVWGAVHGVLLVVHRAWRRTGLALPGPLACGLTFVTVVVALVLFRAPSFERAGVLYGGLAGLDGFAWDSQPYSFGTHEWKRLLPALALVLFCPNRQAVLAWRWPGDVAYAAAFAVLAGISILRLGDPQPFFYFQF